MLLRRNGLRALSLRGVRRRGSSLLRDIDPSAVERADHVASGVDLSPHPGQGDVAQGRGVRAHLR